MFRERASTSDNPLFGEPLDFDTADFDNIEVIDG